MGYSIVWPRWIIATLFALWETNYFGWNYASHSDAEIICDGIALIITALAIIPRRPTSKEGEGCGD